MLEKEIEKYLVAECKKMGGKAFKFVSPGNSGVPDRIVVFPGGKIGFAEIKRPGGKTTALQDRQIDSLRRMGCFVDVVDSIEAVDLFMSMLCGGGVMPYDVQTLAVSGLLH